MTLAACQKPLLLGLVVGEVESGREYIGEHSRSECHNTGQDRLIPENTGQNYTILIEANERADVNRVEYKPPPRATEQGEARGKGGKGAGARLGHRQQL